MKQLYHVYAGMGEGFLNVQVLCGKNPHTGTTSGGPSYWLQHPDKAEVVITCIDCRRELARIAIESLTA